MLFVTELRRLLAGFLVVLLLIVFIVSYLAVVDPNALLDREDNPRVVAKLAAIDRGDIYDRGGRLLVTSEADASLNEMVRVYVEPAAYGMVGYYSLRYGVGGAEAAYDGLLSGSELPETLTTYFNEEILHQNRHGGDVRLTIDLTAQNALVGGLVDAGCNFTSVETETDSVVSCAGIVLSVPNGDVLAMTSLPTYDPNLLDVEWDNLTQASTQPFFNRVLQGQYQPGTLSQLLLMTLGFINQVDMDQVYSNATDVVRVGDVAQVCLTSPPGDELTLSDSFIHGCPAPFEQVVDSLEAEAITEGFRLFQIETIPQLAGFVPEEVSEERDNSGVEISEWSLDDILGQGDITMTPFQVATIVSAYINDGNGINPHILLQTRQSGDSEWETAPQAPNIFPLTTAQTARAIQELMKQRLETGPAQVAVHDNYDMGGMVASASSGDTTQSWFIGWVKSGSREGVVTVILMDNSDDLESVAQVGGDTLVAAIEALKDDPTESIEN